MPFFRDRPRFWSPHSPRGPWVACRSSRILDAVVDRTSQRIRFGTVPMNSSSPIPIASAASPRISQNLAFTAALILASIFVCWARSSWRPNWCARSGHSTLERSAITYRPSVRTTVSATTLQSSGLRFQALSAGRPSPRSATQVPDSHSLRQFVSGSMQTANRSVHEVEH